MLRNLMIVLTSSIIATAAFAAGDAQSLSSKQQVTLNAPAEKVWDTIGDFDALDRWHPAVAKEKLLKGKNNEPGAVRLLMLGDGGTIHEQLKAYNGDDMSYTYAILKSVLPVSHYRSTIKVDEVSDNKSRVTWSGTYQGAKGASDQKAKKTIDGVYRAGLDNIEKVMGKK